MSVSSPSPSARRFAEGAMAFMAGLAFGVLGEMSFARHAPPAPAPACEPAPAPDAGRLVWVDDMEKHMRDAEQKLAEHSQRIHDLEILNRAQCK